MNRSYSKIRHIQKSNLILEQRIMNEQNPQNTIQTGGTVNRQVGGAMKPNTMQTGGTVNQKTSNRPACVSGQLIELGCWLDEIDRVQREIGNPSTWTMDSYNRLQKTLNDYKTWRTTTPEGLAVKDSHNEKNEYVVQLPPHLQTSGQTQTNESYYSRHSKRRFY